jgi:hypothetical protein
MTAQIPVLLAVSLVAVGHSLAAPHLSSADVVVLEAKNAGLRYHIRTFLDELRGRPGTNPL